MIGGWPRERLAIYQTGGDIREGLARGIRHFKIGTRVGPHTPARRAAPGRGGGRGGPRHWSGPDGNLMIDCVSRNGTADWAVGFARQLRPANLYFMEELLSPDNVFGYAELVRRIGRGGPGWTRVACGEHEYTEHGFDVLVRLDAAEVLQPDITWCGGLTAAKRIRDLVEGAGLELIPHRGGSVWGLPDRPDRPDLHDGRELSGGVAHPRRDVAPVRRRRLRQRRPQPGFGSALTERMVLDARLPGTY